MKHYFLKAAAMILLPFTAPQQAMAQQACWFEAEQAVFYEASGCTPLSNVSFYSDKGGGRLLRTASCDQKGVFVLRETEGFHAAFLLNDKERNDKHAAGTGKVSFYGDPEFSFRQAALQQLAGTTLLSWKASVNPQAGIYFDIQASKDGISYRSIGKVKPTGVAGMLPYNYNDNNGNAAYRIVVMSEQKGQRYVSNPLFADNMNISVYPTATNSMVTVSMKEMLPDAGYKVINASGQQLKRGKLSALQSSISLEDLPPGNYIVVVSSENKQYPARVTKY